MQSVIQQKLRRLHKAEQFTVAKLKKDQKKRISKFIRNLKQVYPYFCLNKKSYRQQDFAYLNRCTVVLYIIGNESLLQDCFKNILEI